MQACQGGCGREGSTRALALCPVLGSQSLSVEHTGVLFDDALPFTFGVVAPTCFCIDAMKPANVTPSGFSDDGKTKSLGSRVDLRSPRSMAPTPCSSIPQLYASLSRSTISIRRLLAFLHACTCHHMPRPSSHTIRSFLSPLATGAVRRCGLRRCSFAIAIRIATRRRRLLFGARIAPDKHTRVLPRQDGGTWDVEGRPHLRTQGARHLLRTREGDHPRRSEGIRTNARIGGGRTLRMAVRQETKRCVEGSGQEAARSDHPIRVGVWRTHVQTSEERVRKKRQRTLETNEHRPIS